MAFSGKQVRVSVEKTATVSRLSGICQTYDEVCESISPKEMMSVISTHQPWETEQTTARCTFARNKYYIYIYYIFQQRFGIRFKLLVDNIVEQVQ